MLLHSVLARIDDIVLCWQEIRGSCFQRDLLRRHAGFHDLFLLSCTLKYVGPPVLRIVTSYFRSLSNVAQPERLHASMEMINRMAGVRANDTINTPNLLLASSDS